MRCKHRRRWHPAANDQQGADTDRACHAQVLAHQHINFHNARTPAHLPGLPSTSVLQITDALSRTFGTPQSVWDEMDGHAWESYNMSKQSKAVPLPPQAVPGDHRPPSVMTYHVPGLLSLNPAASICVQSSSAGAALAKCTQLMTHDALLDHTIIDRLFETECVTLNSMIMPCLRRTAATQPSIQLLSGATCYFHNWASRLQHHTIKTAAPQELWGIVAQHGGTVVAQLTPEVCADGPDISSMQ